MTNDDKFLNMTIEERAKFLASERFFGMGESYVLYWLETEAQTKNSPYKTK